MRADRERISSAPAGRVSAAENERRSIGARTQDIVGHALNVMIPVGAAAHDGCYDRDPAQARQLSRRPPPPLPRVGGKRCDSSVRSTHDQSRVASPKESRSARLVARIVQAGMQVEYAVEGRRAHFTPVDGSAYEPPMSP